MHCFGLPSPALARALLPVFLCVASIAGTAGDLQSQGTVQARAPLPVTVRVLVQSEGIPVSGALVQSGAIGAQTDSSGAAALRLSPGARSIVTRHVGFRPDTLRIVLRTEGDTTVRIDLRARVTTIAPVIVMSTRGERRLEEEPLRVEILAGEDVREKTDMRPGEIRGLLREMSGVRVQTTSPALGASAVRIQGLRGRYTQMLVDGLPSYGGQSAGFSLVEVPPVDLRQVEVLKGAAGALYGPHALGGVVNLISRRPPDTTQLLLNRTSRGGADALTFVASPLTETLGLTLTGGAHRQPTVDADGDGWSDAPGSRRAELRPRLFYADSAGRSFMITTGAFRDARNGGAVGSVAAGPRPVSPESLSTRHGDLGFVGRMPLSSTVSLGLRSSAMTESRQRRFGASPEREQLGTIFGEATASVAVRGSTTVLGLAWERDRYRNRDLSGFDETLTIPAAFVQSTFAPTDWISSTVNGRCDRSRRYGPQCAPRVSILARVAPKVSARVSLGEGWTTPTALTEETGAIGLSHVSIPRPLIAERGQSASFDLTATVGVLQVNGTLFAHRVHRPIGLTDFPGDSTGRVALVNLPGAQQSRGGELFAVYSREPVIATVYYAATRTREISAESGFTREIPLTPRQEAGLDLAWEEDESGTYAAVEAFYTGRQALEGNPYRRVSHPYTTIGLLASQRLGWASVFVSVENLTDVRQTRFDPLVRPSPGPGGRWAVDQWAPMEGRVINAGVRVSPGRMHEIRE